MSEELEETNVYLPEMRMGCIDWKEDWADEWKKPIEEVVMLANKEGLRGNSIEVSTHEYISCDPLITCFGIKVTLKGKVK